MTITYAGVTPAVVIDSKDLQNTEKLSKKGNKLVKNRSGVCMSMVVDWVQKSLQSPDGVTDKSQLKSGLALSLAQTAYMRKVFSDAEGFISTHGMSVNASTTIKRKKGVQALFQKDPLISVATACVGLVGCAVISIFGDGGHALGYRQKGGVVQFFDPNEGVLQFDGAQDFAKWFPPYIRGEYPDLLDEVILRKVAA